MSGLPFRQLVLLEIFSHQLNVTCGNETHVLLWASFVVGSFFRFFLQAQIIYGSHMLSDEGCIFFLHQTISLDLLKYQKMNLYFFLFFFYLLNL